MRPPRWSGQRLLGEAVELAGLDVALDLVVEAGGVPILYLFSARSPPTRDRRAHRITKAERTDAALRRLARETGALGTCDRRLCLRSRRCRGPWETLLEDGSIVLPTCLMLKVFCDYDGLQCAAFRLSQLADRMTFAVQPEEAGGPEALPR